MSLRNNITIVSSTVKAINKAKGTGKLATKEIFSFQLMDYLINFIDETITNGSTIYVDTKKDLILLMSQFSYKNSDVICNYKTTSSINNTNIFIPTTNNTAPTVSGVTIPLALTSLYTFKVSDFTNNYSDSQRDSWSKIIIYPSGLTGTLRYNNIIVTTTLEINISNVINLTYTRLNESTFSDTLTFRISDNNVNSLYSIITSNIITGDSITTNQPATLGDNTIYVPNRIETIFTLDMFTSQLSPPYNDPEGDLIDAIRIDTIAGSNLGVFYLNNVPVVPGLIITREQIAANLFTHIGPNIDTVASDYFTFSARDEGSLIWVN